MLLDGLLDPALHHDVKSIDTGIPEEAFNLPCSNLGLKAAVLQEFILLDGKYVERMNELEYRNSDVLR